MSLDVSLTMPGATATGSGIFIRENGSIREITRAEWNDKFPGREPVIAEHDENDSRCYHANITHNLVEMAGEAGIYQALWQPEELGITRADELIPLLRDGLAKLRSDPDHYKQFNPVNGWGDYDGLADFVERYLDACERYPQATVSVSR